MSRQQRILEFISSHIEGNGYSPTVREIANAVGLASSSTVMGHLDRLKENGLIDWEPHTPRTIRVLESPLIDNSVKVMKLKNDIPTVIGWQGRRYVYDPG
ncbi:LexA family protein [Cohnella kolymensis]|uniref:LexA family protein n=1 Tax=Cohnella kolymensis TaxID=1590652 RepID=UPI000698E8F4